MDRKGNDDLDGDRWKRWHVDAPAAKPQTAVAVFVRTTTPD
jgi:hypothetical protein